MAQLSDSEQKVCTKCKRSYPATVEFFHVHGQNRNPLRPDCKSCASERRCLRYRRNPQKEIQRTTAYEKANWERSLERRRRKRETYPEAYLQELRRRVADWKKANPEKAAERERRWRANNRGKFNAKCAAVRASRRKAAPPWLSKEHKTAIRLVYSVASVLGAHVDHIVPLAGENVSGLHVPWNLQILPPIENMKKGNRHRTA
jgi:hypothetical protein